MHDCLQFIKLRHSETHDMSSLLRTRFNSLALFDTTDAVITVNYYRSAILLASDYLRFRQLLKICGYNNLKFGKICPMWWLILISPSSLHIPFSYYYCWCISSPDPPPQWFVIHQCNDIVNIMHWNPNSKWKGFKLRSPLYINELMMTVLPIFPHMTNLARFTFSWRTNGKRRSFGIIKTSNDRQFLYLIYPEYT